MDTLVPKTSLLAITAVRDSVSHEHSRVKSKQYSANSRK